MNLLNTTVENHFKEHFAKFNVLNIIVSGSNIEGEGEHKIFQYIRDKPYLHIIQNTFIYGIDSDLIMLSINNLSICPNIYLFRETPHFIQSIDSSLEPGANYCININELSKIIVNYMNNNIKMEMEEDKNTVYDYIFLSFFLGNDFLPHFPSLNIRTTGIDDLMLAYKNTLGGKHNSNLTDGKVIYWKNVRKLVLQLANQEESLFIREHNLRNKLEKNILFKQINKDKKNDKDKENKDKENKDKKNDKENKDKKNDKEILNPLCNREIEQFINPLNPYWQSRYYRTLFNIRSDSNNEHKKDICINYLEGLEWTMKYYTTGCPNWRWCYKYHYPPLLTDLIKYIPCYETTFVPSNMNCITDIVQLCYVLPKCSLHLLPNKLKEHLLTKYDHLYKEEKDYEFIWAYCKYFWECHIDIPEIDINELHLSITTLT
jgi:5'-3' exoribonuclease 2